MSSVGSVGAQSVNVSLNDIDWSQSVFMIYAQLQNCLAKENKESAINKIKDIKDSQAVSKQYTEVINAMRALKSALNSESPDISSIKADNIEQNINKTYTNEAEKFFWGHMKTIYEAKVGGVSMIEDAGINLSGKIKSTQYDTFIAQLQSKQEQVGTDIQQQMVMIQDYMGQYTSYQSGATSIIQKGSDLLQEAARLK